MDIDINDEQVAIGPLTFARYETMTVVHWHTDVVAVIWHSWRDWTFGARPFLVATRSLHCGPVTWVRS